MVRRVTLDSGVVSAAAQGDARTLATLEAFRRRDVEIVVPAPVVTESTTGRGPRDTPVNLLLAGCRIAPTTESIARLAGRLRFRAKRPEGTVDAIVVATAELVGGRALLTQDLADCRALARETAVRVETP